MVNLVALAQNPPELEVHGKLRNLMQNTPPSQDWNFSWRTLCRGLMCGHYAVSPEDTVFFLVYI